jgi:hypothetical protein
MSTIENIRPNVPRGDIPAWDVKKQFFRMRAWFRILAAIIIFLWIALIIGVLAIAPITDAEPAQLSVGATMAMVLAPVLAAAAVERTLESAFNMIEDNGCLSQPRLALAQKR